MTRSNVRKAQFICFVFAHIPLAAVAAFAYYADLPGHVSLLVVTFLATLASAILLLTYIGRVMAGRVPAAA